MNDKRQYILQFVFILVGVIFLVKLFFIQVLDSNYKLAAESNIVQKIIDYAYRGLVYDRNGELLVYNQPVYDLMIIPKEVKIKDTTSFANLLGLTEEDFRSRVEAARHYSYVKPSVFYETAVQ